MKSILLFFIVFLTVITEVALWTVNLADMKILVTDNEKVLDENKKEFLYESLIKNKKSENVIEKGKYAKEYGYHDYKEKRVTDAINSGSRYLEGLSQALLEYRQMLQSCGEINLTSVNKTDEKQVSEVNSSCITASKNRKIVQRLSELAVQTANKLKVKTYDMDKDGESEENELLLQLAWFLDRLARLTGYVPKNNNLKTADALQSKDNTAPITVSERDSSLELLETVENGRSMSKMSKIPPKMTAGKGIVKRSINPLTDVVKYYSKYKLWNGSNLNISESNFDIDNKLKVISIKKRSISNKKYDYLSYKNITKMSKRISHMDKLRKHVVKVTVVKKLKNSKV